MRGSNSMVLQKVNGPFEKIDIVYVFITFYLFVFWVIYHWTFV